MNAPLSSRERTLRIVGGLLWTLGILVGGVLTLLFSVLEALSSRDPGAVFGNMFVAAALAFPACLVYLMLPLLIDRYDPEPLWALVMAFLWGAVAAAGIAAVLNTINGELVGALLGKQAGQVFLVVVSAPIVEEGLKGLGLLGVYLFLRREFDGVVDGVIYATFIALGFAAMENVSYYQRGATHGGAVALGATIVVRGLLSPWIHPLFTSMTGLGFGLARESTQTWVKFAAPIGGYMVAVALHMTWNGIGTLFGAAGLLQLVIWLPFLFLFVIVIIMLVVREGRIIRKFLADEVLLGNMTQAEVDLTCSPFGRMTALFSRGGFAGRQFVNAAARLAFSKWHATRAMQGKSQKHTISADFIVPLRQEMASLRAAMKR